VLSGTFAQHLLTSLWAGPGRFLVSTSARILLHLGCLHVSYEYTQQK